MFSIVAKCRRASGAQESIRRERGSSSGEVLLEVLPIKVAGFSDGRDLMEENGVMSKKKKQNGDF